MENKKLEDLNKSDLQNLIDNKVIESRHIEYKRDLSINQPSEKKEFLADISSFANSTGGDLIIGMAAKSETGEPTEVVGLELSNVDSEILKIENLIRSSIKPRIWGLQIQPISVSESRTVLVIRIPNSWTSPHRIDFQGHNKFFTRGSNGKYPMDVDELRIAFNLSETISDRIKNFRTDRVNNIYTNQSFIPLSEDAKVVLHLIPFAAFSPNNNFDFQSIQNFKIDMQPMKSGSWAYQFNLDGFMAYTHDRSYTQVFKNGIIEAVNSSVLKESMGKKIIPSTLVEAMILDSFLKYMKIYTTQNVPPPIAVTLSLTNIKEHEFAAGTYSPIYGNEHPHRKEILNLPENLIQDFSTTHSRIFQPIFDSLWNSYGYDSSKNFDNDGNWIG